MTDAGDRTRDPPPLAIARERDDALIDIVIMRLPDAIVPLSGRQTSDAILRIVSDNRLMGRTGGRRWTGTLIHSIISGAAPVLG